MSVVNFLQYNNAVPIALGILFLGATGVFAATNPDVLYSATQHVVSIDNTYIANKDLASYTPSIQILSVTEDPENYYVSYRFTTINIVDSVWRDVIEERKLTVARGVLGQYGDLGLYVTEQLKQVIDREIAYLREVQEIEKRQITNKVVATAYAGLVGAMLDAKTETIPGYEPVVTPPLPPPEVVPINPAVPQSGESQNQNPPPQQGGGNTSVPPPTAPQINGPGAPTLQLLGINPHIVNVGEVYADLGVVVTDDSGALLTVRKYVDGVLADGPIAIDTSTPREFHFRYEATDGEGNIGAVERTVIVNESVPLVENIPDVASTSEAIIEEVQETISPPSSPETPELPSVPEIVPSESDAVPQTDAPPQSDTLPAF